MTWCRVYRAGTRFESDMLSKDDRHLPLVETVLQLQAFKRITTSIGDYVIILDTPAVHGILQQTLSNHQPLPSFGTGSLHDYVLQTRVERYRLIGGQRPGCSGPDHQRQWPLAVAVGN